MSVLNKFITALLPKPGRERSAVPWGVGMDEDVVNEGERGLWVGGRERREERKGKRVGGKESGVVGVRERRKRWEGVAESWGDLTGRTTALKCSEI